MVLVRNNQPQLDFAHIFYLSQSISRDQYSSFRLSSIYASNWHNLFRMLLVILTVQLITYR